MGSQSSGLTAYAVAQVKCSLMKKCAYFLERKIK